MQDSHVTIASEIDRPTRLFVPLASDPFEWFLSGAKQWEVRAHKRQYTTRHVYPGRRVELRRGYSDPNASIWGCVAEVIIAKSIRRVFDQIEYEHVIPIATNKDEAISMVSHILNVGPDELSDVMAFRVERDSSLTELPIDSCYIDKVLSGIKSTTIRKGLRKFSLGPAALKTTNVTVPIIIRDVRYTTVANLAEVDAIADGFTNLSELQLALKRHYPEIVSTDWVSVITLRVSDVNRQKDMDGTTSDSLAQ